MENKAVGMRIRKQRELLGMTREQLAEKLDVSTKFCADIELGNRGMSIETLCKLHSSLHLSCDYILFGKVNTTPEEDSLQQLISACNKENLSYLTAIIQNFIAAQGNS